MREPEGSLFCLREKRTRRLCLQMRKPGGDFPARLALYFPQRSRSCSSVMA